MAHSTRTPMTMPAMAPPDNAGSYNRWSRCLVEGEVVVLCVLLERRGEERRWQKRYSICIRRNGEVSER